ncbi:hypothetical protein [Pseudonocardia nigra]|uniref:hypothetical protein n=1 Tax=Pseudonocardia nigra TaxID=1921578 RepID=UPI001C5FFA26|nr:hypothetical protein [Pseudonocardia nigra]
MAGNERLTALMTDAGFLGPVGDGGRKQFARAVTRAARARGSTQEFTHTYVTRWLGGSIPRSEETRQFIISALSTRLGRRVAADEVGFPLGSHVGPELGLTYPRTATGGVDTVSQLAADQGSDRSVVASPVDVASWNEASLSWIVGSSPQRRGLESVGAVGKSDVIRIRSTRDMFDRMDNQFGGGHAREALITFLRGELPTLLRAGASETVRRALFSAAAEATQLAAWMSYDAGIHGLAQGSYSVRPELLVT